MVISLFFTRNISLSTWLEKGLFDREKLIYEKYIDEEICTSINWFTYGTNDEKIAKQLIEEGKLNKNIYVYQMPKIFNTLIGRMIYSFLVPFLYLKVLKNSSVIKTNQIDGSISAVIAKFLTKKPLIVRTGFTLSLFAMRMKKNRLILFVVYIIELLAYKLSNKIIVSSKYDKEYIVKRYKVKINKVHVLYNYINSEKFYNKNIQRDSDRILTVVRLTEQKNLFNLIEAISETNYILDIYGDGSLKEQLISHADKFNAKVNFLGIVSNDRLTDIFNKYNYFILASYYEGMPKVLLEAMACGCVCTGTNVMGINEVIKNNFNGYLSKSVESKDIRDMIVSMKIDDNILINASKTITTNFTLNSFIKKEKAIILESLNVK